MNGEPSGNEVPTIYAKKRKASHDTKSCMPQKKVQKRLFFTPQPTPTTNKKCPPNPNNKTKRSAKTSTEPEFLSFQPCPPPKKSDLRETTETPTHSVPTVVDNEASCITHFFRITPKSTGQCKRNLPQKTKPTYKFLDCYQP